MVWHQAAATKAARTAQLVNPLGPLGVQVTIGLLILGLKDTYDVLREGDVYAEKGKREGRGGEGEEERRGVRVSGREK